MSATQRRPFVFALCIALMVGGGCQLPQNHRAAAASKGEQIRANCYSLLHDLLNQQKDVDKVLLVKLESIELNRLIKTIASASGIGAKKLEDFAAHDGALKLDQLSLPPGETETREAIASTKTKELLTPFSAYFEFNLLLTQAEALSYAWHLCKVAAAYEPRPEREHYLARLGEEMKDLHHQAISLMRSRLRASGQKGAS